MDQIPGWLGAIGGLLAVVTTFAAAVAVYRTTIFATSLREARATITDLRGEIGDHERRELKLESDVALLQSEKASDQHRIRVLEDLVTKRKDDDEIRAEIAAVREVVDQNVITQLSAILQLLQGGASSTESGSLT